MIDTWYTSAFSEKGVQAIKQIVAILAGITLLVQFLLRQTPETYQKKFSNSLKIILFYLGLTGLICWGNYFQFHFPAFTHNWEIYHYYTGAKYFNELGYTELYNCSKLAERELEDKQSGETTSNDKIRNLDTNLIVKTSEISDKIRTCKERFSTERWENFKSDIKFFKERIGLSKWHSVLKDHGFNATPVWLLSGEYFANKIEINRLTIFVLPVLDAALLVLMWFGVYWAFGFRPTCIAMIFWGTNLPAQFSWTGGAFLRQDWLFFTVFGIAFLKKERLFLSGASLACASLLRIFPVFILLSLILHSVQILFSRKDAKEKKKLLFFWSGCLITVFLLVTLSISNYGTQTWNNFALNSKKHLNTALTNYMGLKTAVTYTDEGRMQVVRDLEADDPYAVFKEKKSEAYQERRVLLWILQALFVIILFYSILNEKMWVAAILGCGIIPVFSELTCYYYSFMLVFALLSEENLLPAILLCFLAWLDYQIKILIDFVDVRYTLMSISYLIFIISTYWIILKNKNASEIRKV